MLNSEFVRNESQKTWKMAGIVTFGNKIGLLAFFGILVFLPGKSERVEHILYQIRPDTTTEELLNAQKNFSEFRKYYLLPENEKSIKQYPSIIASHIVATALNATLVGTTDEKSCSQECKMHSPTIRTSTSSIVSKDISDIAFYKFVVFYKHSKTTKQTEVPSFIQLTSDIETFVYCDVPKKIQASLWSFSLFIDSHGTSTWVCLCVSGFLVICILSHNSRVSNVTLSTIGSLFSFGITPPSDNISGLFLVWMVACMILGCLYTGSVSSKLISPDPDDVIRKLSELRNHNFTLVLSEKNVTDIALQHAISSWNDSTVTSELVTWFLKRATLSGELSYHETLTRKSKVFGLFDMDSQFGEVFALNTNLRKKGQPRMCYCGEERIHVANNFLTILPPGNLQVERVYKLIIEGGILQRWKLEEFSLINFPRLQNRVMFRRLRKFSSEDATTVQALKMRGKMLTVFLLWTICILLSCCGSIVEYAWEANSRRKNCAIKLNLD